MKKFALAFLVLASLAFGKTERLSPYMRYNIRIQEPSDICRSTLNTTSYFIVSNWGAIAEIDGEGNVLRRTKYDGSDYEAICMVDSLLYVVDESIRKIEVRRVSDFSLKRSVFLQFNGPRNGGFESFTYIPGEKKFIAVTESPVIIYELNEQLQLINHLSFKHFGEISSVNYHEGYLWFLSDRDHEVMKVRISDYSIERRWKVPVINPEGICIDENSDLLILSDDIAMLFKFKFPPA